MTNGLIRNPEPADPPVAGARRQPVLRFVYRRGFTVTNQETPR